MVLIHQWRLPLCQFACAKKIDEYDVTIVVPCVCVTSQINCQSEKTFLCDNGEMNDRWLVLVDFCVQDTKWRVRNKILHSLSWITILVTRDVICQRFSLVTSSKGVVILHVFPCHVDIMIDIYLHVAVVLPCWPQLEMWHIFWRPQNVWVG